VCPWNKFAVTARDVKLKARGDLVAPTLAELAHLDDGAFRARFSGTAIKRTGRDRFIRNVLIAIGNSGDLSLACEAKRLLADRSPLVRAMAVWALSKLASTEELTRLRDHHLPRESDPAVQAEWRSA
jgi:epoxyqueuosine reductase